MLKKINDNLEIELDGMFSIKHIHLLPFCFIQYNLPYTYIEIQIGFLAFEVSLGFNRPRNYKRKGNEHTTS